MKKLLFVTGILVILLSSCVDSDWGTTRRFWAQDTTKDYSSPSRFYQLTASLLAENDYCKVWVETASGVKKETAQKVADAYIDIYNKMINAFGFDYQGRQYNSIELADYRGDGDRKLCILLLDIKDGYKKGVNDSSVGGYYYPGDLYKQEYSNECDMIYIDTFPGKPGEKDSNMTLAHELQHLMNEVASMAVRNDGTYYYPMDLWIDEGLSSAAEWVYSGEHPLVRYGWYYWNGNGNDIKGLIDKGNNFFVWGNRADENTYAILDDYATVYLFFQWLRIQTTDGSGINIYRDIISSEYWDSKAVTEAASARIHSNYSDWGTLLRDWLAANYINSADSYYGYKNDPDLLKLKGHLLSTTGTAVSLYPGEGVFSKIDPGYAASHSLPSDYGNIFYYVLTDRPESVMKQGALLTYNLNPASYIIEDNTYKDPLPETGTVTGVASSSVVVPVEGRSLTAPLLSGPYWIGAGDVRRGERNPLSTGMPRLSSGIVLSE